MPLLADYALTPDVFDTTSYSNEDVCGLHLKTIREVLMTEGLVRDLRAGEWRKLFANDTRAWHRWGKELVKKLAAQGRLVEHDAVRVSPPEDDREWCEEALGSHRREPIAGGVIVTPSVKAQYSSEALVESIDGLAKTSWWSARSPSVRLERCLRDYERNLAPILRCANSLQFIDPHLNPVRPRYEEFVDLLSRAGNREPAPLIEIHRVCYEGSGSNRVIDLSGIEHDFRRALTRPLGAAGLQATVFIWDDFHDRYLISNLVGISLPNGFDTATGASNTTTWTRLGRRDQDDIQREFDEASGRHTLRHKFAV